MAFSKKQFAREFLTFLAGFASLASAAAALIMMATWLTEPSIDPKVLYWAAMFALLASIGTLVFAETTRSPRGFYAVPVVFLILGITSTLCAVYY